MSGLIQGLKKSGRVSYRCFFGLPQSKGGFPDSCRKADFNTADLLQTLKVPQLIVLAPQCSATAAQGWVKALLCFSGREPPGDTAESRWRFREFADAFANRLDLFVTWRVLHWQGQGSFELNAYEWVWEHPWQMTEHVPVCCRLCATTSHQMDALGACGAIQSGAGRPLQEKMGW